MTLYFDLPTLFNLFCIGQGLTTATWLFLTRHRHPANRWLAWLVLGLTAQVLDYFLSRSGVYFRHQWLYFMPLFYSWSFGPLFFNYVLAQTGRSHRVGRAWYVPVAVQTLFYALLMAQPLDLKTAFWINVHKPVTRFVDYYVACGLLLYFLWRSWRVLHQEVRTRSWLGELVKGLTLFYVVAAIEPVLNPTYLPPRAPRFYLTAYVLPLLVYALTWVALFREKLSFAPKPPPALPVSPWQLEQVRLAMTTQKHYRNPDLTLASLAQSLGLTANQVSRIINTGFNQSFADFVNTHRVNDVKQRMAAGEAEHVTLLGLALDAGFASKSTFNRVFKEMTGFTPKEYEKKSQNVLRDDGNVI